MLAIAFFHFIQFSKHKLNIFYLFIYLFFEKALAKFETTQKVTNKSGIEQEDALLNESAAKETSLNLHIMDLENEVKQVGAINWLLVSFLFVHG